MATEQNSRARKLCLSCGLCCNGALFADARLQSDDDSERLRELGLPITPKGRGGRFAQPCAALEGCHCTIYLQRPSYCRAFECLLFKKVLGGEISQEAAMGIIKQTLGLVETVRGLLQRLGNHDKHLPLRRRFQKEARRLELDSGCRQKAEAQVFSQLTLVFHDLTRLLEEAFYP